MTANAQRGAFLLVVAFVALLVLLANGANSGPETLSSVASAVLVVGGAVGVVLLVVGLRRR